MARRTLAKPSTPRPAAEESHEAKESRESSSTDPEVESVPASDAFEALGNEVRMAVLRALVDDADEDDQDEAADRISGRTATFSELREGTGAKRDSGQLPERLQDVVERFVGDREREAI